MEKRDKFNKSTNSNNIKNENLKSKNVKKVNHLKVVLLITLLVVIACYSIQAVAKLVKNPTNTVFIKQGKISQEETDVGYIVRDEKIVQGENYKNGMEQIVDEGQKVAKGESIFRYYSSGEDELKKEIADLDIEINELMNKSNEQLFSSDIKLLDSQINEKLLQIGGINEIQTIQEYKKAINDYVMKKAETVGELSPAGSQLKQLIKQRTEYQKKLSNGSEYIVAPSSGILSYKIDGLEDTLTNVDFSKYNKEFLENLNLKTGKIIATSAEQGKIVNNFNCYIITTSKSEEAKKAEIGDKVKLILPSTKEISANVSYIMQENNDETTIVFSFMEGIDELLNYRKISFDIVWWDLKGYKVPQTAIITQNNLNYVIKNRAGYLEKILIKKVKNTENYAIISSYSATELKDLDYDKNAKTSINLYDEIILNPTEEQINSTK